MEDEALQDEDHLAYLSLSFDFQERERQGSRLQAMAASQRDAALAFILYALL